jgi:sigma-B regulation protein RsbU (phosphoserine phosphatase)
VRSDRELQAKLAAFEREHQHLHQDLFSASQVQRRLCSPRQLRRGPFEIASEIFPVRYISGDFFQVLPHGRATCLAVGDIAGKGLTAGFWFTHLVGLIRVHAAAHGEPAGVAAAINQDLCQLGPEPPLAGVFLGRLDSKEDELIYCNAGLPPALVLRSDGRVEHLKEGGPVLGAVPEAVFHSGRVRLDAADALIAYSDGVVECRNAKGEEYGVERLLGAARQVNGASAETMLFSILGAVKDFTGSTHLEDDLTVMVVRRLKQARGSELSSMSAKQGTRLAA